MFGVDPLIIILGLGALGLAPFVIMMVTSYVKIVVVTSLIRNALGVQQVPPAIVMNGLAIILSIFIMAPVYMKMEDLYLKTALPSSPAALEVIKALYDATPPLREFLIRNADESTIRGLMVTAKRIWPKDQHETISRNNLLIIIPAFTITELTKSFQIGFLLYLPFVAIDLVVSNILLAMGMMMVSPMTISLPFKLLLFVTLDGWLKISQGLMLSYR
ncbi:type III secretion system export apparatus subunit SctR [Lawsonia intracellularis]|uniref:Translocation protein in type III secretion n=1 Tax=Lawsonia intracellularis (strain PHE/MN1-00) TaxID=363253 RepID=Q1MQY6_LAWIP|nr:type III secretion system export apparatus subunit SctR [Lawsonia intracellularis]AGC49952.1 type III secretion system protein [Lawsonia intracellularis N343]KAA0205449.1 EscR/YscR/HrcR family type III secretion system export apparatus protein [Lawsonia intracellularis]MBZ3892008.1 type III secretion system export apparatus subunit SctR [Lawsonia intracellularis]OMQ04712.1 EscR/YscR/HrcR family type III secretion system export apparatus protein [Lawsonia intracellularis]RBN32002.1 EscR/YscR